MTPGGEHRGSTSSWDRFVPALVAFAVVAFARGVLAQAAFAAETLTDQTYDASALSDLQGHGYQLSHGLILHPSVRLEGGGTSNVFYTPPDAGPIGSGIMRVSGALYVASDNPRLEEFDNDGDDLSPLAAPLDYELRGGVQLSYQEFLSGNSTVRDQRHFNVLADANLVSKPSGPWSLLVQEQFRRDTSSLTFEDTSAVNRDDNRLLIGGRFQSNAGETSVTVHYENSLQVFENPGALALPSRMNHTLGLGGEYYLDEDQKNALLIDMSYGSFGRLGGAVAEFDKPNSRPVHVAMGVAHEVSSNVTGHAEAGFAHASYGARSDGRTEGYNAPVALAELAVRWTRTGRLLARYRYDHFDSSLSNFYRDHEFELKLVQQLGFLVVDGGLGAYFRQYSGMPMRLGADLRNDTIVSTRARLQAVLAERYSLSLEYRLSRVSTNYVENAVDEMDALVTSPRFIRHDLVAGLTVAY